jgi:hypothetical protein
MMPERCHITPRNRADPDTAERPSVGDRQVIYWVECSCGWRSGEHFDFMAPDDEAAAHLGGDVDGA